MQTDLVSIARRALALIAALVIGATFTSTARANGVPVQVFLDHLPFKATWTPASNARGVAVVHANEESVRVRAQDLPAPPAGQVYYAWLEKVEGGFLPVGPLSYASDGTASVDQHVPDLPYSENFSWVLISLESSDGVGAAPGPDVALAGRLPNPLALPPRGDSAPELLPVTGAQTDAAVGSTARANVPTVFFLLALLAAMMVVFVRSGQNGRRALRRLIVRADATQRDRRREK